jgi:hypothetical protein
MGNNCHSRKFCNWVKFVIVSETSKAFVEHMVWRCSLQRWNSGYNMKSAVERVITQSVVSLVETMSVVGVFNEGFLIISHSIRNVFVNMFVIDKRQESAVDMIAAKRATAAMEAMNCVKPP